METQLPPQPQPDAPAPPPGPEAIRSRFKMRLILTLGGTCLGIFLVMFLAELLVRGNYTRLWRSRAVDNLKEIHLELAKFDKDYGRFPDAATTAAVKVATGTSLTLPSASSNDLLAQLLAEGKNSEYLFSALGWGRGRGPDNVTGTDSNTLAPGECDLTYIAGLSSKDDPATPLLMAPVIRGTLKFDPRPFDGKAVLLRIDGSTSLEIIDKHGDMIIGGKNLFDPSQPFWHGKIPDLKWPE